MNFIQNIEITIQLNIIKKIITFQINCCIFVPHIMQYKFQQPLAIFCISFYNIIPTPGIRGTGQTSSFFNPKNNYNYEHRNHDPC